MFVEISEKMVVNVNQITAIYLQSNIGNNGVSWVFDTTDGEAWVSQDFGNEEEAWEWLKTKIELVDDNIPVTGRGLR